MFTPTWGQSMKGPVLPFITKIRVSRFTPNNHSTVGGKFSTGGGGTGFTKYNREFDIEKCDVQQYTCIFEFSLLSMKVAPPKEPRIVNYVF